MQNLYLANFMEKKPSEAGGGFFEDIHESILATAQYCKTNTRFYIPQAHKNAFTITFGCREYYCISSRLYIC